MVKYCPKCGYPNPDDAQFCIKCGSPLQAQPPNYQQPNIPPQPYGQPNQPPYYYQQPPNQPKTPRKFPVKLITIAAVAVVALVVVLVVVLPIVLASHVNTVKMNETLPNAIEVLAPHVSVTTSAASSAFGGTWTILNNESYVATSKGGGLFQIKYLNGTTIDKSYVHYDYNVTCYSYYVLCEKVGNQTEYLKVFVINMNASPAFIKHEFIKYESGKTIYTYANGQFVYKLYNESYFSFSRGEVYNYCIHVFAYYSHFFIYITALGPCPYSESTMAKFLDDIT